MPERTHTILVVEDEDLLRKAIMDKLKHEGYTVLEASDGTEGLQQALEKHPDFILLDLVMPNVDGMEMIEALRKDAWGKSAQVTMLTNIHESKQVAEAMHHQVFDYLVKSDWKLDDIVAHIREKLGD